MGHPFRPLRHHLRLQDIQFHPPPPDFFAYDADQIITGGTGFDVSSSLPEEIDRLQPDYSIYPSIPHDTAFGFLTRGCPNHCPWCVVPAKEGPARPYMDIADIAIEGRTKIVLMDNNILALPDFATEQIEKAISLNISIDFNQALDARLVTPHIASILARAKWINRRIRFGCDTNAQINHCHRAINLIDSAGFKGEYFLYTMIGGKALPNESTHQSQSRLFNDALSRINHWRLYTISARQSHNNPAYPYAQPYRDPHNPSTTPQWQKDLARYTNRKHFLLSSPFPQFSPRKNFYCHHYLNLYQ